MKRLYWMILLPLCLCLFFEQGALALGNQSCQSASIARSSEQVLVNDKSVIRDFFKAQNQGRKLSLIRSLFASEYTLEDLSALQGGAKGRSNIETRLKTFRKEFPHYQIRIRSLLAEQQQVCTWFVVYLPSGKPVLNVFALFTLAHHKITRLVEMVKSIPHMNS